jgi:hypothetical protein
MNIGYKKEKHAPPQFRQNTASSAVNTCSTEPVTFALDEVVAFFAL